MMPSPRTLSYEKLVEAYERRLDSVLRGFHAGVDGLETWVPDPDPVRSVEGLLDAARRAGESGLVVLMGAEAFNTHSVGNWQELGARHGSLRIQGNALPVRLEFSFEAGSRPSPKPSLRFARRVVERPREPGGEAAVPRLPPGFHSRVMAAAADASHESARETHTGAPQAWARIGDWQLHARVDAQHRVVSAGHWGATEADERGVLELLCQVGERTPILEWADHGVLAVMHLAHEPEAGPPVPGVPQPENTSLLFARANALVRRLLASYRHEIGYPDIDNRFELSASEAWLKLSDAARLERVRGEFAAACVAAGFAGGEAKFVQLRDCSRIVVQLGDGIPPSRRRGLLFRLERELAARVDPSLSVERVARRDLNVIRRL